MRPTPIPDEDIWEGAERRVIAGPNGDLTDTDIAPVEALVDITDLGPRYSIRLALDPGELDALRGGGFVWLQILGERLQPFAVSVNAAQGVDRQTLEVTHTDGTFDASVVGVASGQEVLFVRGCIEALEQMIANIEGG